MNDLDKILDKLCEDPAFVRAYREERITWELQARAVFRYLRGEVERLEAELAGQRGFNGSLIRAWDNDEDELYNAEVEQPSKACPAWIQCPGCEDYWCTIHKVHVFECDCPDVYTCMENGWDPYVEGGNVPVKKTRWHCGELWSLVDR